MKKVFGAAPPTLNTNVDILFFNEKAAIMEKVYNSPQSQFFKAIIKKKIYLIKQYEIHLTKEDTPTTNKFMSEQMEFMRRIYEEYEHGVRLSSLSRHFPAHYGIAQSVEPAGKKLIVHIESIVEYSGEPLDVIGRNKDLTTLYSYMRQTGEALALMESLDLAHFDIKPSRIYYNPEANLIQLVGLWTAAKIPAATISRDKSIIDTTIRSWTPTYYPPEIFAYTMPAATTGIHFKKIDVYLWAMTFFELITGQTAKDMDKDKAKYKLKIENYSGYLPAMSKKLEEVVVKPNEVNLKKEVTKILLACSEGNPAKRPTMSELLNSTVAEKESDGNELCLPYLKSLALEKENLAKKLRINLDSQVSSTSPVKEELDGGSSMAEEAKMKQQRTIVEMEGMIAMLTRELAIKKAESSALVNEVEILRVEVKKADALQMKNQQSEEQMRQTVEALRKEMESLRLECTRMNQVVNDNVKKI